MRPVFKGFALFLSYFPTPIQTKSTLDVGEPQKKLFRLWPGHCGSDGIKVINIHTTRYRLMFFFSRNINLYISIQIALTGHYHHFYLSPSLYNLVYSSILKSSRYWISLKHLLISKTFLQRAGVRMRIRICIRILVSTISEIRIHTLTL